MDSQTPTNCLLAVAECRPHDLDSFFVNDRDDGERNFQISVPGALNPGGVINVLFSMGRYRAPSAFIVISASTLGRNFPHPSL